MHRGTLDINEDDEEIVASIRTPGDMEVNLNTGRMRMALYLANSLSVGTIGDRRELAFIFKKTNLLH